MFHSIFYPSMRLKKRKYHFLVSAISSLFNFFFQMSYVHLYSRTKNNSSHRRSAHCGGRIAAMGRCNCLIFQSMGKNSNARALSAKISTTASFLMSACRIGNHTSTQTSIIFSRFDGNVTSNAIWTNGFHFGCAWIKSLHSSR